VRGGLGQAPRAQGRGWEGGGGVRVLRAQGGCEGIIRSGSEVLQKGGERGGGERVEGRWREFSVPARF